jgi:hypothetical protein
MRRPLLVLGFALLAGILAFLGMRNHQMGERSGALLVDQLPELAWLKKDLQLSEGEFSKVKELHLGYRPKCLEMCNRIVRAREKLRVSSQAQRQMNPELESAIREYAKVQADCQQAMLQHLYQTAAVLSPQKAERFLKAALPAALGGYHGDATESCHAR